MPTALASWCFVSSSVGKLCNNYSVCGSWSHLAGYLIWILVTYSVLMTSWALQCGTFVLGHLQKLGVYYGKWEFAFPIKSPGETAVGKNLNHLKFKIV